MKVFRNVQSDHRQVVIAFMLGERCLWLKNQTSKQKKKISFSPQRRCTTTLVFGIPNSRSSGKSVSASITHTNSFTVSVSEPSDACRTQERLNEPMDVQTPFAEVSVLFSFWVLCLVTMSYLFYEITNRCSYMQSILFHC